MSLASDITKLKKSLSDAQQATSQLENSLKKDAQYGTLDKTVSASMLEVYNQRVAHGIALSYAVPAKLSSGGGISSLSTISEAVPGTKLKSVRVNMSGSYESYQGLMDYFNALKSQPIALVGLKVKDQSFEAGLRIYGNEVQ